MNSFLARASSVITSGSYFHGGTYTPGSKLIRPLYLTKGKKMAESYVAMSKDRTGKGSLVTIQFNPKSRAPDKSVEGLVRQVGIDNEYYTPASVFDSELHGVREVAALISKLKAKHWDHAILEDIPFGGNGKPGLVTLVFPT